MQNNLLGDNPTSITLGSNITQGSSIIQGSFTTINNNNVSGDNKPIVQDSSAGTINTLQNVQGGSITYTQQTLYYYNIDSNIIPDNKILNVSHNFKSGDIIKLNYSPANILMTSIVGLPSRK